MNRFFLVLLFVVNCIFYGEAQTLSFENSKLITEISIYTEVFTNPLIPWDYNSDSRIDFFGSAGSKYLNATVDGYKVNQLNVALVGSPIKTEDVDKNGTVDYVTTSGFALVSPEGAITFVKHTNFSETICETADFDQDGYMDYVTGKFNSLLTKGNLTVWFNNGNYTFTPVVLNSDFFCQHVLAEDLNNDGIPDIIATGLKEKNIYFMKPDRTYKSSGFSFSLNFNDHCQNAMDIDNDNDLDLIVYRDNYGFSSLLFNNSSFGGDFKSSAYTSSVVTFIGVDLNDDAREEILFLYENEGKITVAMMTVNTDFSFGEIVNLGRFATFPSSYEKSIGNVMKNNLSVIDLDLDGRKDIIYSDGFGKKLHWFKNLTPVGTSEFEFGTSTALLYPNPVETDLNILLSDDVDYAQCMIFDLKGRLLNKIDLKHKSTQVDVSFLTRGNYIAKVVSAKNTIEMLISKI